jgi:hypothetical protein
MDCGLNPLYGLGIASGEVQVCPRNDIVLVVNEGSYIFTGLKVRNPTSN